MREPVDRSWSMKAVESPSRLRVVLADDDPLARAALRRTLQDAGHIVVAEVAAVQEALEITAHYRPDVLLLDVALQGGRASELVSRLRATGVRDVAVVVLTVGGDNQEAVEALIAGASGWLTKDVALEDLPPALAAAVRGEVVVTRRFTRLLVDRVLDAPEAGLGMRPVRSALTPREWDVLDLMRSAASEREIAAALHLSPATVRAHTRRIMRKLGVTDADQAVAAALELNRTPAHRTNGGGGERRPTRPETASSGTTRAAASIREAVER